MKPPSRIVTARKPKRTRPAKPKPAAIPAIIVEARKPTKARRLLEEPSEASEEVKAFFARMIRPPNE
jgi:hypothetical protein